MTGLEEHKATNDADGSPRYWVDGPAGRVQYDYLGNHLFWRTPDGDIEAAATRWASQVRALADEGADEQVFALLGYAYQSEWGAS